jgi:prefoldin beta subunit
MTEKKQENEMVLTEFKELKEENVVYKLVGPILAKQELSECRSNVEKRVEFIDKEIARQDALEVDF